MNECSDMLLRRWPFLFFGVVALLHIFKKIQVDGYGIGLLVLAFLPAILPLIAKYLKSLKVGKDGVEAVIADDEGKTSLEVQKLISSGGMEFFANEKPTEFPYPFESRKILATLWYYQKDFFGEDSIKRWGFGIGIGASDYENFHSGITPISDAGLVSIDRRGICYLTNEGINFCKKHRDILDGDGPGYTQFSPAPN